MLKWICFLLAIAATTTIADEIQARADSLAAIIKAAGCEALTPFDRSRCEKEKNIGGAKAELEKLNSVLTVRGLSQAPYNGKIHDAGKDLQSARLLFLTSILASGIGTVITMNGNYKTGAVLGLVSIPLSIGAVVKIGAAGKALSATTGLR